MEIVATQDCDLLTPESLADFDAVVFCTTGELPVPDGGREALIEFVRGGGGFVGVHCASDTFYEFPPYQRMLGGVFDGHPWTQPVTVRVEDPSHPAVRHLGPTFEIDDEIYQHRDFERYPVHVLLSLDTDSVDAGKGKRSDGDYALAWCRPFGEGRVFYTALGHRLRVWSAPRFQRHVLEAVRWTLDGPDLSPPPPEGAVILFGGDDGAAWQHLQGPFAWRGVDGAVEVVAGTGNAFTREAFGDALLHVEFRCPPTADEVRGQAKGNSGVYIQGRYEVQVLDSYGVAPSRVGKGDCGALYGQKAPDVNATRPGGRWQSYDIRFRAPRFDESGAKVENARVTVWHNGLLIHEDVEIPGPTAGGMGSDERAAAPLMLQDHGNPVRYRNIWILPSD
jgi:type 1 glutamine amidotransferase